MTLLSHLTQDIIEDTATVSITTGGTTQNSVEGESVEQTTDGETTEETADGKAEDAVVATVEKPTHDG